MSRKTADKAEEYLTRKLKNKRYKFFEKGPSEKGFDLWMKDKRLHKRIKIELKACGGKFTRWSDIFQKLCFSAPNEVNNFERGKTKIIRIFLGNHPPKVFIFDKKILKRGAKFKKDFRARIVGPRDYESIEKIQ